MSVADYRALVQSQLEAQRGAVLPVLEQIATYPADCPAFAHLEIAVAELTERFPLTIICEGADLDEAALNSRFDNLPALLAVEEEAKFILWEDGPHGPQHALVQPVLDEASVERTVILPWLSALGKEAGLEDASIGVSIGLHDDAAPLTLSEPKGGLEAFTQAAHEEIKDAREIYKQAFESRKRDRNAAPTVPGRKPGLLRRLFGGRT